VQLFGEYKVGWLRIGCRLHSISLSSLTCPASQRAQSSGAPSLASPPSSGRARPSPDRVHPALLMVVPLLLHPQGLLLIFLDGGAKTQRYRVYHRPATPVLHPRQMMARLRRLGLHQPQKPPGLCSHLRQENEEEEEQENPPPYPRLPLPPHPRLVLPLLPLASPSPTLPSESAALQPFKAPPRPCLRPPFQPLQTPRTPPLLSGSQL
jgi:hypothetical protein